MSVGCGTHFDRSVVVCETIEARGTNQLIGDGYAGIEAFVGVGHDATLDQINHRIIDEAGMNTEISHVRQAGQNGIRNLADTELQCRAVGNQAGGMHCDLA